MPSSDAAARSTRSRFSEPYPALTGNSSSLHPSITPASRRDVMTGATTAVRASAVIVASASSVTIVDRDDDDGDDASASSFPSSIANTPSPCATSASANARCMSPTSTPATTSGVYVATSAGVISLHSATRARNPGTCPE
eukprot:30955-Pelagococcus_subviridis.AAC.5